MFEDRHLLVEENSRVCQVGSNSKRSIDVSVFRANDERKEKEKEQLENVTGNFDETSLTLAGCCLVAIMPLPYSEHFGEKKRGESKTHEGYRRWAVHRLYR